MTHEARAQREVQRDENQRHYQSGKNDVRNEYQKIYWPNPTVPGEQDVADLVMEYQIRGEKCRRYADRRDHTGAMGADAPTLDEVESREQEDCRGGIQNRVERRE